MNEIGLPAMYSTVFWCLLVVLLCFFCHGYSLPREGTPLFGLYGYVPLNRVWFSKVLSLKQGIQFHY